MTQLVEGWSFYMTPISVLGSTASTRNSFTFLMTLQSLSLSAFYRHRKIKPLLSYIGTATLMLIAIYDIADYPLWHNLFACIFFIVQPIIFFLEYRKKRDTYSLVKFAALLTLIILVTMGIMPIPIFEFISYALLIVFI